MESMLVTYAWSQLTCSEDQSVRVWNTGKWEREAVLTGHQLAVTSVDWKMVGERSILVSCSDDRVSYCTQSQFFCY